MRILILVPTLMLAGIACMPGHSQADDASFLKSYQSITAEDLARHIAILASDEFEGRAPGTAGEEKTLRYLEDAFRRTGAEPGFRGGYLQPVPLLELTPTGVPGFAIQGDREIRFEPREEFVTRAGRAVQSIRAERMPVVFAGYGVTAPEFGWDDYADTRVDDAAVILLRGEPTVPADSTLFRGRALTVHGLPDTKYENAARHGARVAIVIHVEETAGYPWSVMTGGGLGSTQNFLEDTGNVPGLDLVIHLSEPAARRLLKGAGLDLDQLSREAASPGFRALRTDLTAGASFAATVERIISHNVIARISGREAPEECVIYTAHWDHVGRNDSLEGDGIFNGAIDNATGTAGLLELAEAFATLPEPPRRTVYLVATTAEEKGLLGSEYLAAHPLAPLSRTAAVINLDALFPFGSFSAMTVTALGSSEIEEVLAGAAGRIGRVLQDDSSPEAGAYYRSDHYPFAKRGVPALFAVGNPLEAELTEDSPILARFMEYLGNGYHKPTDEYDPDTWDLTGVEEDVRVFFETGLRIAEDSRMPNWTYGNEFRRLRDRMLRP